MLDEYQDEFINGLGDEPIPPQTAGVQPKARPAQYSNQQIRRPNPQNREYVPSRGYQYQIYEKPEPIYDSHGSNEELAQVLSHSGPGLGFVKTVFLGGLSLVVIVGSFYTSFTLGKKIFQPNQVAEIPSQTQTIPFSVDTSSQEIEQLEKSPYLTKAQKHLQPVYELDEANRIKKQMTDQKNNNYVQAKQTEKPVSKPKQEQPKVVKTQPKHEQVKPKTTVVKVNTGINQANYHRVIAGAFSRLESAKQESQKLQEAGFQTLIYRNADNLYRVQIGVFKDLQNAQATLDRVIAYGYPAFISQN